MNRLLLPYGCLPHVSCFSRVQRRARIEAFGAQYGANLVTYQAKIEGQRNPGASHWVEIEDFVPP
jgi:hypothetical protein